MLPNHRRGGVIAGILFTILILGALAIAAVVATGLYIAQNVRVTERTSHGETTVETPFGSVRVRETRLDPTALGVPVYPGAVRNEDSHKLADFHFDFGGKHKEFAVAAAEYRTYDRPEKVVDFYRDKLPHWMVSEDRHGACRGMRLSLKEGGYKKFIAIYEDDGETRIALASVGEPASN
ncbi:MAG: hypothetical protein ABSH32_22950 [Bryobacteraceae bacterium]|jgi:hypothetical protein